MDALAPIPLYRSSLFAALDVRVGKVVGRCYRRHRAEEFRAFLAAVDAVVPADLEVHVVLDNASIHKAPPVRAWLAGHPRYHLHFTPTASSWLNQVERFFALLTARQLTRGVHRSVEELEAAVLAYVERHNAEPKPFRWTRSADDILASVARFCSRTLAVHRPDLQQTSETHHKRGGSILQASSGLGLAKLDHSGAFRAGNQGATP